MVISGPLANRARALGAATRPHVLVTGPHGVGKDAFVARAKELAAKYGDRFTPPKSLL